MSPKSEFNPRIDKWLWAVRIFKTRNMAANACKKGKILINGIEAKPSHTVKIGEEIEVRFAPISRTYKVLGLAEKRMSAKLVPDFMEETTPPQEIKKLKMLHSLPAAGLRDRGAGRPTKKERRDIEKLQNDDLF